MVAQPLRAAGVGQSRLQNGFHQGVTRVAIWQTRTGHHVAHHIHIGSPAQFAGAVTSYQFDSRGTHLFSLLRVDAGVATGDSVAGFAGEGGQAAHEGAADT